MPHLSFDHMSPKKGAAEERLKAKDLAEATDSVILRARGMFPFTLFPDEIVVDKNKVDVIHNHFFFSKTISSILLKEIKTVTVTTGIIMAAIYIEIEGYEENPEAVTHLPKGQAYRVRDAIMGLTLMKKEDVDLTKLSTEEALDHADHVGQTSVQKNT